MTVKLDKNGKWLATIDRKGAKRVRKHFRTEEQALAFERGYIAQHVPVDSDPYYLTDKRTLSDLVLLWFKYHGVNLADSERRKRCLLDLCKGLGNPLASELTPEHFVSFRYAKLEQGLSGKAFNNRHGYLCAVYNKLLKLKVIDYKNPIAEVDFIKLQERQLSYLSKGQIKTLLDEIRAGCVNESTWYVTQICLRTGARWGEVEKLKFKQLHNGLLTYEFTKSKKTRTVPLDTQFYKSLLAFAQHKNPEDRIFTNCIGSFRRAVKRAGLELPKGQNSHILRHSFASHFIMNGGGILTLQKILGHADVKQTMNYAHLAPEHLQDAVRLNPVAA